MSVAYNNAFTYTEKITVCCNQTHELHTVEASTLSLEEGDQLTEQHLTL